MTRSWINVSLMTVLLLSFGVIWPDFSSAAQAPALQRLGEIEAGLRVPTRIDVDAAGNLYVADARRQEVIKYDRFGRQVLVFSAEKISGAGLAVSADGHRLYVSAFDKVVVYGPKGNLVGYLGRGTGEFTAAGSIDLDSDGNVYVADLNERRIKVYSPFLANTGVLGNVSFVATSSMVINPHTDEIYIAESAISPAAGVTPQVKVYDRTGNLLRSISADNGFGSSALTFFGGMTFDDADRFYVGDIKGMSLRVISADGTPVLDFDNNGKISRPASLVFDESTSRLYVVKSDQVVEYYGVDNTQAVARESRGLGIPVPLAPVAGSEVASLTPGLRFRNPVDIDGLTENSYTVRVFDAAQQLVSTQTVPEQAGETMVTLETSLQENGYYRWQVQSFDGQQSSEWSELQPFFVNAEEEAPTTPQLISPLTGEEARSRSVLSWQCSSDSDPFDSLRYRVEVALDPNFSGTVISREVAENQLQLSEISADLDPGRSYYWRVAAVDNHGLEQLSKQSGQFKYFASALVVTASMKGSRVYLGGHQGYAGQFVGVTPLNLRDLQPGRYQVVVEHSGFESFVIPVELCQDGRCEVYAQLQPALVPQALNYADLPVAGQILETGQQLVPQVADVDLDGVVDLLLASADGGMQLHPGVLTNEQEFFSGETEQRTIAFGPGLTLNIEKLPGAAPCLVDWNNDYRQDLVVGAADGSVRLFLNQGGQFVESGWLTQVSGNAVPTVADVDGDGNKDLVIGSDDGELVLLRNVGSDSVPQLAQAQLLVNFSAAAAPAFVDWDADGQRELLVAAEGQLYHAVIGNASLQSLAVVETSGAEVTRICALDLDGVGGKDLVAATADGRLVLASAAGERYADEFYLALEEKLLQLQGLIAEEYPVHLSLVDMMFDSLANLQMGDLKVLSEELIFRLPAEAAAQVVVSELLATLQ